jgi:hypothetical protein
VKRFRCRQNCRRLVRCGCELGCSLDFLRSLEHCESCKGLSVVTQLTVFRLPESTSCDVLADRGGTSKLPCFRGLGERPPGTCLLGWNHLMKRACQLARCAPARPSILVKLSSEKKPPQKSAQIKLVCAEKSAQTMRRKVRKLF